MGNLLSIAKSVQREIDREGISGASDGTRGVVAVAAEGTVWWPAVGLRMAPIYYVHDNLAPVVGSLPLLISRLGPEENRVVVGERSSRFS